MQCNIDLQGRRIRRIGGWICSIAGAGCLAAGFFAEAKAGWLIAGSCLMVGGMFQLYEARKGWCALRAMGVKVPF